MVMTVECPECGTAFPVDPGKVPASGVRAQCSVCPGIFPVFPFESDAEAWKDEGPAHAAVEPAHAPDAEAVPEPEPAPEVDAAPEAGFTEEPEFAAEPEVTWEPEPVEALPVEPEPAPEPEAASESTAVEEPVAAAEPEPIVEPEAPGAIQFGRRDPHEKAKRLARVLVSDMIVYHREKHTRALESGTLAVEFEEEVEKSWEEYVDQIGSELAESTPYFREALNEILAKGEEVF